MTVEEIVWDIMEIKSALEVDSDVEPSWILHKINQYRAVHIEAEFNLTNEINPVWLQRVLSFDFEKVTAADDPQITISSIELGKAILPRVIWLKDDMGLYRLSGSGAIRQMESCNFNLLLAKIELRDFHGRYGYYSKVGDTVYCAPYIMQGSAFIIAENPMDVKVNDNGSLRDMQITDQYPLDPLLAQRVILDVLTKDFNLAEGAVTDIVNDAQSELKIMKDGKS